MSRRVRRCSRLVGTVAASGALFLFAYSPAASAQAVSPRRGAGGGRGNNNGTPPAARKPTPPPLVITEGGGPEGKNAGPPPGLPLIGPGGPGGMDGWTRLPFGLSWGDAPKRLVRTLAGGGTKVTERRATRDGSREVWTVEGLLRAGPKLGPVLLTFRDQALAGVELRYGQADWTSEQFNEAMGFLRRQLERDLGGPGELVSRETTTAAAPAPPPATPSPAPTPTPAPTASPAPSLEKITGAPAAENTPAPALATPPSPPAPEEPPIKQTLTGYAWKRSDCVVELFYFAAEQPEKKLTFRTLSVHYRYVDPYAGNADLPGLDAAPAPPGMEIMPNPKTDPPGADPLPQ